MAGIFWRVCIVAVLASAVGCVSPYATHLTEVRRDFYDFGEPDRALEAVEKRQKRAPESEQSVWKLNRASLAITNGDFREAKNCLREVRDEFDDLEDADAKKLSENVLSYWTDDSTKSYCGDDYEKIMIRSMLAIADLFDGAADARAYAHQIALKQDEIVMRGQIDDPENEGKKKNPKLAYPRVPLGPYLEGLLWEETYLDSAEAARCYALAAKWRPKFTQAVADCERAQTGVHSQPGNGRLYLFAFVGRGPRKVQVDAEATQMALLIADRVFSAVNKYSVPPTVAPVPVPALVVEESRIDRIALDVDSECAGETETIADVSDMAVKQYEAVKDQIIARAVMRRIVKKGTLYAAKQAGDVNGWVSLAIDVGGVVWEAMETADTRCWGVLPAKIQILNVELPAGRHQISVRPLDAQGRPAGRPATAEVVVPANRNAYALINYPGPEPVGELSVSGN